MADAALLGASAEPQAPTSTGLSTTLNNTVDSPSTHFQPRGDIHITSPIYQAPVFQPGFQQSLNLPPLPPLPDTSIISHPDSIDPTIDHISNQGSSGWACFYLPEALPQQGLPTESQAVVGGYNDSPVHLGPWGNDLQARLLSLHPHRKESDSDSYLESSSTLSNTRTPTPISPVPQDNGKNSWKGGQSQHPGSRRTDFKEPGASPDTAPPPKDQKGQRVACPFWKRDPTLHGECYNPKGYKRIRDVKQHLRRRHLLPITCARCGAHGFDNEDQRDTHLRVDNCNTRILKPHKGITRNQEKLLRKHSARNGGPEAQWYCIWDVVFPKDTEQRPKSPYVLIDQSEDLSSFIDFFQYQGRGFLAKQIANKAIVDKVLETFSKIHGVWRSQRGLGLGDQSVRSPVSSNDAPESNDFLDMLMVPNISFRG